MMDLSNVIIENYVVVDNELIKIESDIISKHMFPLTFYPPKYKESVVICLVDKICSIYEVFSKNAYRKITRNLADNKRERRIIERRLNPYC